MLDLDKLVTFCFDRFEIAATFSSMTVENPRHKLDAVWRDRWWKAAHHYAAIRDLADLPASATKH